MSAPKVSRIGRTEPFIYKGSGKKQAPDAEAVQKRCWKQARHVQYCLAKNGHQEKWCKLTIDAWRACEKEADAAEAAEAAE